MLKSKIHRARVTGTRMDYEGSIEIDPDLMDRVGILPYEQVHVFNINTGGRLITYAITCERGSGTIALNGAAARLAQINDRIIIVAYGIMGKESDTFAPKIVLLNEKNQVVEK